MTFNVVSSLKDLLPEQVFMQAFIKGLE